MSLPVAIPPHQKEWLPSKARFFVALTAPATGRWQEAGWRVGNQPVNTDIQQAPLDCSLNPIAEFKTSGLAAARDMS